MLIVSPSPKFQFLSVMLHRFSFCLSYLHLRHLFQSLSLSAQLLWSYDQFETSAPSHLKWSWIIKGQKYPQSYNTHPGAKCLSHSITMQTCCHFTRKMKEECLYIEYLTLHELFLAFHSLRIRDLNEKYVSIILGFVCSQ